MSDLTSEATFDVVLDDVRAFARATVGEWIATGDLRQWLITAGRASDDLDYRCSRRARLKWAAAEVWAVFNDVDAGVHSGSGGLHPWCDDPARLGELVDYLLHMPLDSTRWRHLERVKIGWVSASEGLDNRIRTLQTGAPFPLTLLGCFRGTRSCEAALHRRFKKQRRLGEWFDFAWEIELAFRLLARDPTRRLC